MAAESPDIPEWTRTLDTVGWFGYWKCNDIASLRLGERHARTRKSGRHAVVLAAPEQELLINKSPGSQGLAKVIATLDWSVSALLARWSLSALLRELEEQLPSIQDAADRASQKLSGKTLGKLQQQLLRSGLDSRIVVNDIVRYSQNRAWSLDVLEFTRVTRAGLGLKGPEVTLTEWLRQGQADDGRRVLQVEEDLREVLSTNAELTAASTNIRLQWIAIGVAVVAALAAVVAVIIAIWPHATASAPAQRPNTTHTVIHSPITEPTAR